MRPRIADTLKQQGYAVSVGDFRTALAEIKAGRFADWPIDESTDFRDEAEYCQLLKERLGPPS